MERRTFVSFTLQDYAGLKSFIFFIENFTHEDMADIGGAGYEDNIKRVMTDKYDVFDPIYDKDFDICQLTLPRQYKTIICMDTLEHLYDPISASKNIINSLKSDGFLFITCPFLYHQHDYEGVPDYYRYTDTGLKHLFKDLDLVKVWYSEDIMDQLYSHQPINKFNRLNYIGYKK